VGATIVSLGRRFAIPSEGIVAGRA
jgi:hypothetical protein